MTKFGEWKIWNGGECPLPVGSKVQIQLAEDTRKKDVDSYIASVS